MFTRLKQLLFQNRSGKQTIVKNAFWLTFGEAISRLIRVAIIVYAARILGAAEYGIFSYAVGLAGFFTVFADIGLIQILTREVAQKPEEKSHHFVTALWIKIAILAATGLFITFLFPYLSHLQRALPLVSLIALLTTFDGIRELSLAFLRALERMELEAFTSILMNIAITGSGFIVLVYSTTAKSLMLSYVLSAGVGTLIVAIILRSEFKKILTHFRKDLVKPIIQASLPFAFLALLGAFMLNTDLVMLGWWRSAEEIGFYSAAQKIILVLYLWSVILGEATLPAISRFVSRGKNAEVRALLERAVSISYLVAIPIAIGGTILGKSLILFLYGAEYAPAIPAFQILINTCLIVFPSVLISNTILAYNKQKRALRFVAIGSIAHIFFDALLIPKYGYLGSATATIVTQLVSTIPMWQIAKQLNYFSVFPHLKKIIPSALIMGIISFMLDNAHVQVLLTIGISGAAYFGVLFLLREKLIEEIKGIAGAIKQA